MSNKNVLKLINMDTIDYWFDGKRFIINPHTFILSYAYIVKVYVNEKKKKNRFNEDMRYDD